MLLAGSFCRAPRPFGKNCPGRPADVAATPAGARTRRNALNLRGARPVGNNLELRLQAAATAATLVARPCMIRRFTSISGWISSRLRITALVCLPTQMAREMIEARSGAGS